MTKTKSLPIIANVRGNAVIEFALTLPILLLVVFGITELGRMIMTTNVLNTASREGARYASVNPVSDSTNVRARVLEVLTAASVEPSSITVTYNVAGNSVTVQATSDFEILSKSVLPAVLRGTIQLTGQTVFRFEG